MAVQGIVRAVAWARNSSPPPRPAIEAPPSTVRIEEVVDAVPALMAPPYTVQEPTEDTVPPVVGEFVLATPVRGRGRATPTRSRATTPARGHAATPRKAGRKRHVALDDECSADSDTISTAVDAAPTPTRRRRRV
jgi:hypothetical protein